MRLLSARIKIHQILISFETTNQLFFKFYINLQCHETTPLYFFSWNLVKSNVWNLALWWAPFAKIILKRQLKIIEKLLLLTLKSDAKFKEKQTCSFKYDMRNFVNFHSTTQKSQNFTLMFYFCLKYIWGLS